MDRPKALTFDVFGTVVDWRASIAREGPAFGERHGIDADWERFADDHRLAVRREGVDPSDRGRGFP